MKRMFFLICVLFAFSTGMKAEDYVWPNNSVQLSSGLHNKGMGNETLLGLEHYFGSNHRASLYGNIAYLHAHKLRQELYSQNVSLELGFKKYIKLVKERCYAFASFGLTAGIEDSKVIMLDEPKQYDTYFTGSTIGAGVEYLLTKHLAVEIRYRYKRDNIDNFHIWGGGLKYSF